ncbi:MAG: hypothetical protein C4B58_15745 [Deltaproteobacteria bacterium]|nr:MAG: hypothetical protein C4B58_15745 [Deltaproteobacteria bacterium]
MAIFVILYLSISFAYAATLTIDLNGFPNPTKVESFCMIFDVGDNFVYSDGTLQFGSAVPFVAPDDTALLPWMFTDNNPAVVDGKFRVDMLNGDVLDPLYPLLLRKDGNYSENNLLPDGTIASFVCEGTIDDVEYFLFSDVAGNPVEYSDQIVVSLDGEGAHCCVPIPGALVLLGSGLIGLIGLGRRRIKES